MTWHGFRPVADGHADTLTALGEQERSFWGISERGHLDLPRLIRAGIDLQVLAVCSEDRLSPGVWARQLLSSFISETAGEGDQINLLKDLRDWERWESTEKVGLLLSLEGLEPLEGDPEALEGFYRLGIRMASLTWNHTNPFAGGAMEKGGLTDAGRELIQHMGELGIALDLSHLNKESFWQVIEAKPKCPILASHSNAAAIIDHPRNLEDDQIRAIAELGGTVGVALYPPFLTGAGATLVDAISHIKHIHRVGGAECPALGCDYDGIHLTLEDVTGVDELPRLFTAIRQNFAETEWGGIIGANLTRVLRRTAK